MESLEDRRLMALTVAMVKDLRPGAGQFGALGSNPREFYTTDDHLFFFTGTGTVDNKVRLWASDGTEAGTVEISLPSAEYISDEINVIETSSSRLYLVTWSGSFFSNKLWFAEGSSQSAQSVIEPGYIRNIRAHGDVIYFAAGFAGSDPWLSDGTIGGTHRLIEPLGQGQRAAAYSASLNGTIYFVDQGPLLEGAYDAIFRTNGTPKGTELVFPGLRDVAIDFKEVADVENRLYFLAGGSSLWVTDGSSEGTRYVRGFSNELRDLTAANGLLFFTGNDSSGVHRVWRSDGTLSGTFAVGPPWPRISSGGRRSYAVVNDLLYFAAADGGLWRTDGTEEGTVRMPLGDNVNIGTDLISVNGIFFAYGWNVAGDKVIWRTDGTAEGTSVVAQLANPYIDLSRRPRLAAVDGTVFFNEWDEQHGVELWSIKAPAGDTNYDGVVDLVDLNNVRNNFGYEGDDRPGDVTGDGIVGLDDLNAVRNHFGVGGEAMRAAKPSVASLKPTQTLANARAVNPAAMDAIASLLATESSNTTLTVKRARRGAVR